MIPKGPESMRCALLILLSAVLLAGCGGGIEKDLAENQLHVTEVTVGEGRAAVAGDHVLVRLEAAIFTDGDRGRDLENFGGESWPLHLRDGQAMPGLVEALVGMREGGVKRLVVAPAKIGRKFRPDRLLSDEALWCEVELLSVVDVAVEDLEVGEGRPVAAGQYVEIEYTGWHAGDDGAKADQFISSEESGEPARLLLGAGMVNEGLDRGLLGMSEGGLRRVVVPALLGYGAKGNDGVRPDATLIYELRLRRIFEVATETLREGSGEPLITGQKVSFHLKGWLRQDDGTKGEEFQDSRTLTAPYSTILGSFKIQPGIELGLNGMLRGELRRIHVPSDLAFGSRGWHRGPRTLVPPGADVIYEIDVLD